MPTSKRSVSASASASASASGHAHRPLLTALYGLSGFCLLALETLWIRTLGNQMGGTAFSSAVIIGTFFVFAALGNLLSSRFARRGGLPLYGCCELGCALAAVLLFLIRPWLAPLIGVGQDGSVLRHFAYAAAIIGLPSCFNGAAFPALAQLLAARCDQRVSAVGPVYAANLAGAAVGALLGGIFLPELCGYTAAFTLICALQAAAGLAAWLAARSRPELQARSAQPESPTIPAPRLTVITLPDSSEYYEHPAAEKPRGEQLGFVVLIASGVLSILLEMSSIACARQFTAQSMYSVAAVLFAFIVNFTLGSWLAARLSRRMDAARLLALSLTAAGFFCVVATLVFTFAVRSGMPLAAPDSVASVLLLALTATVLLAPLHIPAGMVFPLAWSLVKRRAAQGAAFGQIVAWNKLGSAAGAFAGPFVLFAWIGIAGTQLAAGALYLALAVAVALRLLEPSSLRRALLAAAPAGIVVAALALVWRAAPVDMSGAARLVALYEGADGIVAVTDDVAGSRHIVVNNSYVLNGTDRALKSQQQESWIPLLLCKDPRRVAFIGMASGISASAALDFPIEHLDTVELIPEVARAAREHFSAWNAPLFSDPRARVCVNDGRYVIQSSSTPYDLIVCDLFLPGQEGTSSLYSRDFLAAAREKLSSGGKFCLWLPLYQLDRELGSIAIRTFLDVFPNAIAVRGNMDPLQPTLALIGSSTPIDLSSEFLAARLDTPAVRRLSARCPFFRSLPNARLLLVGDLRAAAADFAPFEINSDDHPVFAFKGPRTIAPNDLLHGFGFLNWLGQRFFAAPFPSCMLGAADSDELRSGIRAGNYFYAASINALPLPIPLTPEKQLERTRNSLTQFQTATRLSPRSDLKETDLGQ